ncbi:MAG TPA: hypothetical protein VFA30_04665 [Gaiellaceae bacterium]|nr:hypothetical protein [Gaiellaceae bacterium]
MRHLRAWLAFWVALFWLWLLFSGDWNRIEVIAAACAATVAASVAELARTRAGVAASLPVRVLAAAPRAVLRIGADFALITVALFRRSRGETLRRPFHEVGDDPRSAGLRAFTLWAAAISPNAIPIDIDREREQSIVHDLIRNRSSERPL